MDGIFELGSIRQVVASLDAAQVVIDEAKADHKQILEGAKAAGLRPDALKSAMKLRALEPEDQAAWLRTFDAAREAVGLNAQLDFEDAIREHRAAQEAREAEEMAARRQRASERLKDKLNGDLREETEAAARDSSLFRESVKGAAEAMGAGYEDGPGGPVVTIGIPPAPVVADVDELGYGGAEEPEARPVPPRPSGLKARGRRPAGKPLH